MMQRRRHKTEECCTNRQPQTPSTTNSPRRAAMTALSILSFLLLVHPVHQQDTTIAADDSDEIVQYPMITDSTDTLPTVIHPNTTSPLDTDLLVSRYNPIYIVVPLPMIDTSGDMVEDVKNPFGLSIPKVQPLIDLAVEEVYSKQIIRNNSLVIIYRDTQLSDAHGPNVAVEQYVKKQIDCIIGYAYGYALAPVARMTPYWGKGIPVITPSGMTTNLDDKTEYKLMTRISSPYKVVSGSVREMFNIFDWKHHIYMFHYEKTESNVGECFLLMASIKRKLEGIIDMQHNYYTIRTRRHNETWAEKRNEFKEYLRLSSFMANGESFPYKLAFVASSDTT